MKEVELMEERTDRFGAMLSNSSKKSTQGFAAEARSKRSLTWSGRMDQHQKDELFSGGTLATHTLFGRSNVLVEDLRALD